MKSKLNWLEAALLVAPFLALAFYWNDLPARVPTHWNLRGEIDGWSSKTPGVFLIPLINLGMVALLRALPWLDPKLRRSADAQGRMLPTLRVIRLALLALLDAIFYVQIAVSLGRNINGGRVLIACTLVFLAILGNYLGNLRPNYFAGIRTPWTLEDPETWRATHRLGGRLIFFGSLALLVIQFFLSDTVFGWVFAFALVLLVVWGIFYSWHHSRSRVAQR